jgi:competence protein ComEC
MTKFIVAAFIFVVIFSIRLDHEQHAMSYGKFTSYIQTGQTYDTTLIIRDDPETLQYSAKVVTTDETIDRRVVVVGGQDVMSEITSLQVGDKITASGYLGELTHFQQYLRHEHVVAQFHIETVGRLRPSSSPIYQWSQKFRDRITSGCKEASEQRGICEGLLIGEKSHIDKHTYDLYRDAQMTHLLVASGANIAFLVAFITPLIRKLSRTWRLTIIIALSMFYCCATRCDPSIVRATVMVIVPSFTSLHGYKIRTDVSFTTSIAICLLIDPFLIYRIGFWLSAGATAGLYFLAPQMRKIIPSELIANTIATSICVMPLIWMTFGFRWPIYWPLSALGVALAEPLSTIGMASTFICSFAQNSWISSWLAFPMKMGCSLLTSCAQLSHSHIYQVFGIAVSVLAAITYTGRIWQRQRNEERLLYYR